MIGKWFALAAGTVLLGALFGCVAVGPNYVEPAVEPPDAWQVELAAGVKSGTPALRQWWQVFADADLTRLIGAAEGANPNVRIAMARVAEARARRGVSAGAYAPALAAGGDATRFGLGDDLRAPDSPSADWRYTSGLDASWEIDFWGRIRRGVEVADANIEAAIEDYRDVLVALYAEVSVNYIEVRSLQTRIRHAEGNARIQAASLQLAKDRFAAELVPEIDVQQAELALATTEAAIPQLRIGLSAALNRLAVLTGRPPAGVRELLGADGSIPVVPPSVLVGLPADLLRQRPDVRAAERRLAAQTAQVGVATAELFPKFSLSGAFGFQGTVHVFDYNHNRNWSFGPSFQWRLFEGGRIRNQIKAEDARVEQALSSYELAILSAYEDFENAVTAYLEEGRREAALQRSVAAAGKALELVLELYRTGLTDFQNVLDMQRSATVQQDAHAQSQGQLAGNLVRIYKAMGGGWQVNE